MCGWMDDKTKDGQRSMYEKLKVKLGGEEDGKVAEYC